MKRFVLYLCIIILTITISGCGVNSVRNVNAGLSKLSTNANVESSSSASTEVSSGAVQFVTAEEAHLNAQNLAEYFKCIITEHVMAPVNKANLYGNIAIYAHQGDELDCFVTNYGVYVYMFSDRNNCVYQIVLMDMSRNVNNVAAQEIASMSEEFIGIVDEAIIPDDISQTYLDLTSKAKTVPESYATKIVDGVSYMATNYINTNRISKAVFAMELPDAKP